MLHYALGMTVTAVPTLPSGPMLVTGASGFIGGHLVRRLLTAGANVRVLLRPHHRQALGRLPFDAGAVDIVWGDVTDGTSVHRSAENVHTVFHLAAWARAWARRERTFDVVNRLGTEHVLNAAAAAGVRRVVHVSTELAAPSVTTRTAYQASKKAAEAAVVKFVQRGGDAVIVRPTRVFGPGALTEANSVTRLLDLYRRGFFRFRIADGSVRANYVYVEDVVAGIILAANRGVTGFAYYLGGEDLTLAEFLALVDRATGTSRRVVALPTPLALALARVCEHGGSLGIRPLITRDWVRLFLEDRPISCAPARHDLGYEPRSVAAAVEATVRWLAAGRPWPVSARTQVPEAAP